MVGKGLRVNLTEFQVELELSLQTIARASFARILLLSPTACADPVARKVRRRALPIFSSTAKRNSCDFLDISNFSPSIWRKPLLYYDAIHLDVAGHRAVALRIAEAIVSRSYPNTAHISRVIRANAGEVIEQDATKHLD